MNSSNGRAACSISKDRLPLLRQIEKRVLGEQVYQFPVLWWQRIVPHNAAGSRVGRSVRAIMSIKICAMSGSANSADESVFEDGR